MNLINKIGSELSKMFLFQLKVETYLGVMTVLLKKKLQLTKVAVGGAAEQLHRWSAKTQSRTSLLCCSMARIRATQIIKT